MDTYQDAYGEKYRAFGCSICGYQTLRKEDTSSLFAGGNGSSTEPFLIENEEQLRNMALAHRPVYHPREGSIEEINYWFKLENNITVTEDWVPFELHFTGDFDGNGHYISYHMNLTQADIDTSIYQGFFGFVTTGGNIHDLEFMNCSITSDTSKTLSRSDGGSTNIGIVAGSGYGTNYLTNVIVTNPQIECKISNAAIGGLVGTYFEGSADNCVVRELGANGEVTSTDGLNGASRIVNNTRGALGGMAGRGNIFRFRNCRVSIELRNTSFDSGEDAMGKVVGNSDEDPAQYGTTAYVKMDKGSCLAEGALITLADGTQKPVEELTGDEMLLVWNFYTGQYDAAPIVFIDSDPAQEYSVVHLTFSNGETVRVVSEHGFWDYTLNRYVYLDENAAQFIGHWFFYQNTNEDGARTESRVQLTGATVETEIVTVYSPVTYGHLCYFVNGMLSVPGGISGLFNIFEVDPSAMRYDSEAMRKDIEQYGLFSYEEFAEYVPIPQEIFEAFNGKYLKVAIGKGLTDYERLVELAHRYEKFFAE